LSGRRSASGIRDHMYLAWPERHTAATPVSPAARGASMERYSHREYVGACTLEVNSEGAVNAKFAEWSFSDVG